MPRRTKLQRVYPVSERLCLPLKYRGLLLKHFLDKLGHFAVERLFLTLFSTIYWPKMYEDIKKYCQTCDICLRTKRNYQFKTKPLNPLDSPDGPFQQYHLDFKDLTRKTKGAVAILCIIDAYTSWPILRTAEDMSAETAGKTFFESVVTFFGVPRTIVSDRGANFCSRFFSTLAQLLGIKHRISSARSPRTNGLAESLVQRLSGLVKLYAKDDLQIPEIIPFCSMVLRATNHTQLNLSPFELTFGRKMSIGMPAELTDVLPKFPERQYTGPYFIFDRVQGPKIGVAYKLVNVETGKSIKALIGGDRLKKYTAGDRNKLDSRLSGTGTQRKVKIADAEPTDHTNSDGFEPAIKIEREKISKGKKQYLVLFKDRSRFWCSDVSHGLLQEYRIRKSRNTRRKKRY